MLKLNVTPDAGSLPPQEVVLTPLSDEEIWIGRLPDCRLMLASVKVSRRHAKITYRPDGYYFTDVGSLSGSQLNGQPLTAQQSYLLKMGDQLTVADFKLQVVDLALQVETGATIIGSSATIAFTLPQTLSPSDYMPVALMDPGGIPRWAKGDLTVRCSRIIDETHDVKTFCFVADPPILFTYKPGQFITLDLEIDGESVLRSYSISSTPSRPHSLEITVKRVPAPSEDPGIPAGQVSNWLHDHLKEGQQIKLSGPLGKFTCFAQPTQKLLFISAGSGITPMMAMTRWVYDTASECDVVFVHSARSPQDIIYRQELETLASRMPNLRVAHTISRPAPGQPWSGFTGRLSPDMLGLMASDYLDRQVYVCGPDPFMAATKTMLTELNFPMQNYFEESFGPPRKKGSPKVSPPPAGIPGVPPAAVGSGMGYGLAAVLGGLRDPIAPVVAAPAGSVPVAAIPTNPVPVTGSLVVFAKSGKEVAADADQSILELAEQEGVKIRSSCRAGTCGSCKKIKKEGEVRSQDFDADVLESDEVAAGYILTCISYPQGRVVIEA